MRLTYSKQLKLLVIVFYRIGGWILTERGENILEVTTSILFGFVSLNWELRAALIALD